MGVKKGEKFKCESCGIILTADNDCSCETCDIICCGQALKKVE